MMSRITIYTTQFCGYCRAAKQLLMTKGLDFDEIAVDWDPEMRQDMMRRAEGRHTVPQIFIDERPIGGYQDLAALERSGKLDDWIKQGEEPLAALAGAVDKG